MYKITDQEMGDLQEIRRLLDEAYDNYFAKSDGYSKPEEGRVWVQFPNYSERKNGESGVKGVVVYSYVLGPSRLHNFESTRDALDAVRAWHEEEMNHDYSEE